MEISKLLNKSNKFTFALQNNFISYREKIIIQKQQINESNNLIVTTHLLSNNNQECSHYNSTKIKKCRHVGCNKPVHTKHRRRHETSAFHQRRPCPPNCYGCTGEFKKGRQKIN
ncbi:hypothetical protein ACTFIU_002223 [Dictyostelium citrinum]